MIITYYGHLASQDLVIPESSLSLPLSPTPFPVMTTEAVIGKGWIEFMISNLTYCLQLRYEKW